MTLGEGWLQSGKVIVATSEIGRNGKPYMRYSHVKDYSELDKLLTSEQTHVYEVLHEDQARCLYFDLDLKAKENYDSREGDEFWSREEAVSNVRKAKEFHIELIA